MNITREMEGKSKFVSPTAYYNKLSTLGILHILAHRVYSIDFYTLKFSRNT